MKIINEKGKLFGLINIVDRPRARRNPVPRH